jgi:hypothetical protein
VKSDKHQHLLWTPVERSALAKACNAANAAVRRGFSGMFALEVLRNKYVTVTSAGCLAETLAVKLRSPNDQFKLLVPSSYRYVLASAASAATLRIAECILSTTRAGQSNVGSSGSKGFVEADA